MKVSLFSQNLKKDNNKWEIAEIFLVLDLDSENSPWKEALISFALIFEILLNPLSANLTKWSNTLKQFVGKLPTNCLSVFDHFVGLALKGLTFDFSRHEVFSYTLKPKKVSYEPKGIFVSFLRSHIFSEIYSTVIC